MVRGARSPDDVREFIELQRIGGRPGSAVVPLLCIGRYTAPDPRHLRGRQFKRQRVTFAPLAGQR